MNASAGLSEPTPSSTASGSALKLVAFQSGDAEFMRDSNVANAAKESTQGEFSHGLRRFARAVSFLKARPWLARSRQIRRNPYQSAAAPEALHVHLVAATLNNRLTLTP